MVKTYVELAGLFLVVAGFAALVIAAALVSTALAVGAVGLILLFLGSSAVYLANVTTGEGAPR